MCSRAKLTSICMEAPSETLRPRFGPLQDNVSYWNKIRRLHLIIVDTWSPWQYNTAQVRAVTDLMKHLSDTPEMRRMVPMMPQGGRVPPRCRRFVYGYALGHSEFSYYLLWPCRVQGEYWLCFLNNAALVITTVAVMKLC